MNCNPTNFGKRLKEIRKERGLTLRKTAQLADMAQSSICEIEHGKKLPGIESLSKLCNALQVSPNRLLLDL